MQSFSQFVNKLIGGLGTGNGISLILVELKLDKNAI